MDGEGGADAVEREGGEMESRWDCKEEGRREAGCGGRCGLMTSWSREKVLRRRYDVHAVMNYGLGLGWGVGMPMPARTRLHRSQLQCRKINVLKRLPLLVSIVGV